MEDCLRPHRVEDRVRPTDVGDVQLGGGGDVLALALREVVEDVDLVPALEQRLDHVRADEARAPGYERPHAPRILGSSCSSPSREWTAPASRRRPGYCATRSRPRAARSC